MFTIRIEKNYSEGGSFKISLSGCLPTKYSNPFDVSSKTTALKKTQNKKVHVLESFTMQSKHSTFSVYLRIWLQPTNPTTNHY